MKKSVIVIVVVIMIAAAISLVGCAYGGYPNVNTKFDIVVNDNLSITGMDDALLDNADRGFRGEVYITLGRGVAYPGDEEDPYDLLDEQLALEAANIKVLQTYVYLIEYADTEIPQSAFDEMKRFFMEINSRGAKMLLRFTYEYTASLNEGPTTERILSHCAQIKSWINDNYKLFMDTVYSMQLGMIGLWGEGHGNVHPHNIKSIISAVCDMTPEPLNVMVRTADFYKKAAAKDKPRLSIHDDFLVGIEHEWGIDMKFNSLAYKELTNMTKQTISDGELPWGRDKSVDNIDLDLLLKQIRDYGLTTLSLTHNYMESDDYINYELYQARTKYITRAKLDEFKLPYNSKMLVDDQITYFDYLNYHLGYQIAMSNYNSTAKELSFVVNNFGLACPIGYNMEVYVDGELTKTISAETMKLYQFGQYKLVLKGDYTASRVEVKFISTRDNSVMSLANNLPLENGKYTISKV